MWAAVTTEDFDAWFRELDEEAQIEVRAKVKVVRTVGPNWGGLT
jgi:hypothetical protein